MPRNERKLGLHEELLLLVLKDREGTPAAEDSYRFALGGAILAELLLQERIRLAEPRMTAGTRAGRWLQQVFSERHLLEVKNTRLTADPVLDDCLGKVGSAKRRASLKTWIQRIGQMPKLRHRVAEGLCRKGVLRAEVDQVFLIFQRKVYPELDPRPEQEVVERLRRAIVLEGTRVDARTTILLSLCLAADLLKIPIAKKTLKSKKRRIEAIVHGETLGQAAKEAVEAARAAAQTAYFVGYG